MRIKDAVQFEAYAYRSYARGLGQLVFLLSTKPHYYKWVRDLNTKQATKVLSIGQRYASPSCYPVAKQQGDEWQMTLVPARCLQPWAEYQAEQQRAQARLAAEKQRREERKLEYGPRVEEVNKRLEANGLTAKASVSFDGHPYMMSLRFEELEKLLGL